MSWIPLHVHSQYSILDSTLSIKKLIQRAKEYSLPSVALTDHGNLFGAVDFYKACVNEGIKPIIGSECWVAPFSRKDKKRISGYAPGYPIVLLAKNEEGYRNLCKLSSIGYIEGFYYYPRIDRETLQKHSAGLICLSGATNSLVASLSIQGKDEALEKEVSWYKEVFQEDYYFEIVRHKMAQKEIENSAFETWVAQVLEEHVRKQEKVIEKLQTFSTRFNISLVCANDTHYLEREDAKAHEVLINVQSGEPCLIWERDSQGKPLHKIPNPKRKIYPSREYYFKSPQEMGELFSDIPSALTTSLEIAEKCNFAMDFTKKHYPVYIPPHLAQKNLSKEEREKAVGDFLYQLCEEALPKRYTKEILERVEKKYPDKKPLVCVKERLDYEFSLISSKGLCDYLLIVYDFIAWAKKKNIPVGPGRGSAAGSIIAYLIGITDIEPLSFHLFFERFINPERMSYPDIDVDICMDRRQEVIDYMIEKYGQEKVAQIITFGTMKAKMAIKDVGRVLSVPLAKVNEIAKLVPDELNITLERALAVDPDLAKLYETDEEAKSIIDMAQKIEGSIRNTSTHAAGMIVSASPITEHLPICTAKDTNMLVTQFAMKPAEQVGMLKIDFLGLKTLTSIQTAVEFVEKTTGKRIDWANLPLNDQNTFDLLTQGKTLGIFQLESSGMQDLVRNLQIDHFEEIIAVGALYRPGPMDMIPSFINRKHKKEIVEIEHPLMKEILEETYGVMVYQEQVMQIASLLAGYSLGEGDVLRRAMGKKDKKEMGLQRKKFLQGAKNKGIAEKVATEIFNKIEKFASYGFNKSHAAAYAYLSYATAYFKANYPEEWMAALMTSDKDDLSKVAKFIGEAKSMSISMLAPDINSPGEEFVPSKEGIRFAMSGIKGVGSSVVKAVIQERKEGAFSSLYDFIQRIDKKTAGKKQIELLTLAGAFDFTGWSKDALRQSVDPIYEETYRESKEKSQGVLNFLDLLEKDNPYLEEPSVEKTLTKLEKLQMEKELLGFYLSGHPIEEYRKALDEAGGISIKEVKKHGIIITAFVIDKVQFKISAKSQKKFAILQVSDEQEKYEVPIWPDMVENCFELLEENRLLFALLDVEKQQDTCKIQARFLSDDLDFSRFQEEKKRWKKRPESKKPEKKEPQMQLQITIDAKNIRFTDIVSLKELFDQHPGNAAVRIVFIDGKTSLPAIFIEKQKGIDPNGGIASYLQKFPWILSMQQQEVSS
ncbi:MAG: DNA polymerase III subunit alpha [Chlamydiota bacterium]